MKDQRHCNPCGKKQDVYTVTDIMDTESDDFTTHVTSIKCCRCNHIIGIQIKDDSEA